MEIKVENILKSLHNLHVKLYTKVSRWSYQNFQGVYFIYLDFNKTHRTQQY